MLQPKRTKFRKVMTGRNRGLSKGTEVSFGEFGLKAVGRGLSARVAGATFFHGQLVPAPL